MKIKRKKKQIQTNIAFCLHYPERHPPKNKCGGLWVSKDLSKPVYCKITEVYKTAPNYKTPYGETQTSKATKTTKYDTVGYENPKLLCGKKRTYIHRLLKSTAEATTRDQRYAKTF